MSTIAKTEYKTPMLKFLQKNGIDLDKKTHTASKMKCCEERSEHDQKTCIHGIMDLSVETWFEGEILKISVCHYYLQNGDMMRDPEMTYRVNPNTNAEIVEYYRQDGIGIEQEVFFTQNGKEYYRPKLMKQLEKFTRSWVQNLKTQMNITVSED